MFWAFLSIIYVSATVDVVCDTTEGSFTITVNSTWSPKGAARFLQLVDGGFYSNAALFRVVPDFLVQFGIAADPAVNSRWSTNPITDDPDLGIQVPIFKRGMMAFAGSGPNTRTSQVFISFKDSGYLGRQSWSTPFAQVTRGMDVVDAFYAGYGDLQMFGGRAPDPTRMQALGNSYLSDWPNLDYILRCQRTSPSGTSRGPSSPASSAPSAALPEGPRYLQSVSSETCPAVGCGNYVLFAKSHVVKCSCDWPCLLEKNCCSELSTTCPALVGVYNTLLARAERLAAQERP